MFRYFIPGSAFDIMFKFIFLSLLLISTKSYWSLNMMLKCDFHCLKHFKFQTRHKKTYYINSALDKMRFDDDDGEKRRTDFFCTFCACVFIFIWGRNLLSLTTTTIVANEWNSSSVYFLFCSMCIFIRLRVELCWTNNLNVAALFRSV